MGQGDRRQVWKVQFPPEPAESILEGGLTLGLDRALKFDMEAGALEANAAGNGGLKSWPKSRV
ncbi:hypothetical protein HS125_08360 [bacterium]|nr:hypothetical protein [bacterium]